MGYAGGPGRISRSARHPVARSGFSVTSALSGPPRFNPAIRRQSPPTENRKPKTCCLASSMHALTFDRHRRSRRVPRVACPRVPRSPCVIPRSRFGLGLAGAEPAPTGRPGRSPAATLLLVPWWWNRGMVGQGPPHTWLGGSLALPGLARSFAGLRMTGGGGRYIQPADGAVGRYVGRWWARAHPTLHRLLAGARRDVGSADPTY